MYWNNQTDIQKIVDVLRQDKIVLGSTDTVMGLLGQLTQKSYDELDKLKQRRNKPYLLMIRSADLLPKFIDQPLDSRLKKILSLCWPGPVTFIFKAKSDLPSFLQSPDGTIALRVPNHVGLLSVLESFDGLFSTSANMHTQPLPETLSEVDAFIKHHVGGICVDVEGQIFSLSPSTILDCSSGSIKVVRAGCALDDKMKDLID